ncbi:PREDICTED: polyhomeotic-like protein 1 isoform X1 [Poecilia mexicana]|uniref:polyhomeotic-like protein 1 isoform X1 n=1 Tax=Poecilia mexicana TaxID=48701 RepID=UPI00072E7AD4|nr:PREDICTED: polyhomeotic-like protein 1 isoform X1 [Poecilia mexicana]XP_014845828.1 PREDICTED: polyhomeotic-like protein 1 isoform X1 [Poecilia mexicana]
MEADGEQSQQGASTNGSAASGTSSRPSPMNSMSAYERQAVQALQALQRQPNAAQYFQQLMLQQQINSAQLQNLAAVQQVKATLAASRQSSPSSSSSQTSTTVASVTSGAGSTTSSRPLGASATSTISQSVLLSGATGGQGQMYLRVNRSLRPPMSPQLIFMPGSTATAAVATVAQQPQSQQQQEVTPASSSSGGQSDNDQAQNLAIRGVTSPKGVGVKTEAPDRTDSASYSLVQPSHPSTPQSPSKPGPQPPHIKIPTYPQPTNLKAHPVSSSGASSSSSSSTSSIPLSQLLLHGTRTLTTGTTAPTAAHALVLTSSATSQAHGYPVGTATIKPAVNAQTLVVQPLQKTALGTEKSGHSNGPIPIQPKTFQGLRVPLQLPSRNPPPILPAPPPASSSNHSSQPPHIPVQIVGARQSTLGGTQALALARGSCSQEGAAVLSSSSSLLTMVASITSREGGVVGRGVGLKTLQTPQEAAPPAQAPQVHPQTNQSSAQSQNGSASQSSASSQSPTVTAPPPSQSRSTHSLPQVTEEQRRVGVTTNGDSSGAQTPQGKQVNASLKRKSDSGSANDEDGPSPPRLQPVRDHTSAPPGNPVSAGSASPPPASSSPTPILSVSRGACSQGERASPPQAVVKPHVLTHLIEGFVIQEGAEPFPQICGPAKDSAGEDLTDDSPDTNQSETVTTATVLKCEYCKNFAPANQFRGTKRFCSMSCAKSMYWFPRYNVSFRQKFGMRHSHSQRQDQDHATDRDRDQDQGQGHFSNSDEEGGIARRRVPRRTSSEIASAKIAGRPVPAKCRSESSHSDEESSGQEDEEDAMSLSPASSASCHQPPPPAATESSAPNCLPTSPAQWTVEEVSQFISSLQGCEELASQFLSQEIDGQALLLLKEEHLMSTMNIKLGPALKICAHINNLRD